MRKFFLRLFFLSLPILFLIGIFIIYDPFRFIYSYADYSYKPVTQNNRDFVSSATYLKNHKKYNYDSFIFGSSRTIAYRTDSWKKHLTNDVSPFKFDASSESIYGIYTKFKYLEKTNTKIKNCLILICSDATFARDTDDQNHIFIKNPTIAGTSWFNFYLVSLKDYLNFDFLKNYLKYLITNTYTDSMKGYIENSNIKFDPKTNDFYLISQDSDLAKNESEYYKTKANVFFNRDSNSIYLNEQITKKHIVMLKEIRGILEKNKTNYKIVISPLYDQKYMNIKDLTLIKNIFGDKNVFDFSGKNSFTMKKENYYENSHYRPFIGDSILNIVYKKQ